MAPLPQSAKRHQQARFCAAPPCAGKKLKSRRRAKFFGAALTLPPTLPSSPGKQKGGDGGERRGGRKGPGKSNWKEQGGRGGGDRGLGSVTQRMGRADWFGFLQSVFVHWWVLDYVGHIRATN